MGAVDDVPQGSDLPKSEAWGASKCGKAAVDRSALHAC